MIQTVKVVRVKQAAEAAASGKRLLLMFDELLKGTKTPTMELWQ
jgi:hypothetical protein